MGDRMDVPLPVSNYQLDIVLVMIIAEINIAIFNANWQID